MNWPPVDVEQYDWDVTGALASRRAVRRHHGPYLAAVPPEIADITPSLPADLVAEVDDATNAIVRFDSEMGVEIAPYSALLLRTESAASSRIEHLTASARAIAEAELLPPSRSNASLIVASTQAMTEAIATASHIDAESVLAVHRHLLGGSAPDIAGRWRTEQVWIGGSHVGPHEALFVPPHARRLTACLRDLFQFIGRDDLPVLAHAALAHAQFETIHPFADGNGRVGRALLHAQLRRDGVTANTTVPVSAGLLADVDRYFDALTAYRSGDARPIIERINEATFAAIDNGRSLVDELRTLRADWSQRVRSRQGSTTWRVLEVIVQRPVISAAVVADELDLTVQNVYRAIAPLQDAGVLVEFTDNKRNRKWRADEVLACLDRFSARAGRRGRSS